MKTKDQTVNMLVESFGRTEPVFTSGTRQDGTSYQFRSSAKYTDAESGLVYYGYRYYQSSTARWVSRDPIEERAGASLYSINFNDTVDYWDLLGGITDCCGGTAYEGTTHSCCNGKVVANLDILDEYYLMLDYANVWNTTSAPYSGGNQCNEQAIDLQQLYISFWPGPPLHFYFYPEIIGGRKPGFTGVRRAIKQHYAVVLKPKCDGAQLEMVLDPMKKPATEPGVNQVSWQNDVVEAYHRTSWRSTWPLQPYVYDSLVDIFGHLDPTWDP